MSLISSKPAADRDDLHQIDLKNRDRKTLKSDISPLRDEYRNGDDDVILKTVESFFANAKSLLWDTANEKSYIYKTIGVSALFDVLRSILSKYEKPVANKKLLLALESAKNIDFSNNFFQASGKGRSRVKNVYVTTREPTGGALPDRCDQ